MTERGRSTTRRAVFVSPLPPPIGGIATWTRTLMRNGLPRDYAAEVVDTTVGTARDVFSHGRAAAEIRRTLRIFSDFLRALRGQAPAIVHLNVDALALGFLREATCGLIARRRGIPVVIHYRGMVARLADPPGRRFQAWAVRQIARRADLNIALNEPSRVYLQQLIADRSRVVTIPNYYDNHSLPEPAVRERRADESLRLVFVGGLIRSKGTAEVVETARRVPEANFHMLGRRYPETEAVLESAPENVIVHGEVDHDEVIAQMSQSHAFFFPTRHCEGFPNVVCEAMAMGLAVVSSPEGSIPEMIDEGKGGMVVAPEPADLERALRVLLGDDSKRVAMGRYNQEKSRRLYAYDAVVERLTALYDEICGGLSQAR